MLAGRHPGHLSSSNIKLLATNVSKSKVYNEYCSVAEESGIRIAVLNALDHLEKAGQERRYYQQACANSKASLPVGASNGQAGRGSCSFQGTMHYSFDFAQRLIYPSNPLQPGPIFFKTPRKCGLLSVACEAIPCQVNFLLEECVATGKGANCVVSLLHYFLRILVLKKSICTCMLIIVVANTKIPAWSST
ncbi:hypothetical protein RRG08_056921 [Elysia crispata]|uniref:Uncharacterized protein n=1 Tax=Elysia crispata TaxID=231223 RepID=A0AAE1AEH3_9GAST|nr:hypothetical protein RRG08_056921 [Elysia crispata]